MREAPLGGGHGASCAFQGKASRASGRSGQLPGTRGRGGRLRRRGITTLTNTIVHWKGLCAGGLVESLLINRNERKGQTMSIIDNAIKANRKYSHTHNPKL